MLKSELRLEPPPAAHVSVRAAVDASGSYGCTQAHRRERAAVWGRREGVSGGGRANELKF